MYRLIHAVKFEWSVVRYGGMINPYFTINGKGTIRIHWVELQDTDGKVMGCWHSSMIPRETAAAISRWIQESSGDWEFLSPEQLVGMSWDILS